MEGDRRLQLPEEGDGRGQLANPLLGPDARWISAFFASTWASRIASSISAFRRPRECSSRVSAAATSGIPFFVAGAGLRSGCCDRDGGAVARTTAMPIPTPIVATRLVMADLPPV